MNLKLAKAISVLFHPAIYPLVGLFFVLKYLPYHYNREVVILSMVMVFCGTYLIPVLVSLLLYRFKVISSLMMEKAEDRRWPYAVGTLCFFFTASLVQNAGLAREAYLFLFGSAATILLHLPLLKYLKPSAHLAGFGGFLGLLLAVSAKYAINLLPFIALFLILGGLIASARLALKAHTGRELLLGFLSGLLLIFCSVYLL